MIGVPGGTELVVILTMVVLLFGPSRLPRLARAGGESLAEFRTGCRESMEVSNGE